MNLVDIGVLLMTIPLFVFVVGIVIGFLMVLLKDAVEDRDPVAMVVFVVIALVSAGGLLSLVGSLVGQKP